MSTPPPTPPSRDGDSDINSGVDTNSSHTSTDSAFSTYSLVEDVGMRVSLDGHLPLFQVLPRLRTVRKFAPHVALTEVDSKALEFDSSTSQQLDLPQHIVVKSPEWLDTTCVPLLWKEVRAMMRLHTQGVLGCMPLVGVVVSALHCCYDGKDESDNATSKQVDEDDTSANEDREAVGDNGSICDGSAKEDDDAECVVITAGELLNAEPSAAVKELLADDGRRFEYRTRQIWVGFASGGSWGKWVAPDTSEYGQPDQGDATESKEFASFVSLHGWSAVLRQWQTLATALGSMHEHHIAHLDVKPYNIVMERDSATGQDEARLIDFATSVFVPADLDMSDEQAARDAYDPDAYWGKEKPVGWPSIPFDLTRICDKFEFGTLKYQGAERFIYKHPYARDVFAMGLSMLELLAPGVYDAACNAVGKEPLPIELVEMFALNTERAPHELRLDHHKVITWYRALRDQVERWRVLGMSIDQISCQDGFAALEQYDFVFEHLLAPFYDAVIGRVFDGAQVHSTPWLDAKSNARMAGDLALCAPLLKAIMASDRSTRPQDANVVGRLLEEWSEQMADALTELDQ
jgi:hypothetical protein